MAAYATSADLIARCDPNLVAQLLGDDVNGAPAIADLEDNANLTALLADASGQVEAALLVGQRYTTAQLDALTGNSLGLLKRITCTVAMAQLFERRPGVHVQTAQAYLERADKHLEDLRAGKRIFNVAENVAKQTPTINGPTSYAAETRNLITERMGRHIPPTIDRQPTNRG